ncbi:hypothetical protein HOL21_00930 [Candidatus Woesearchaeota archaeon]|jgi:hypothetical protein|nr:hypothetical protein [Candidatus Woesearchaeota archaeon]MBT5396759.1 hypothetical protein [Candidatus Woesearchaeota archaeon]MBT5924719.1 hypothetical protein [Candidatus Woesearchaeota archaeon]MBT6367647.1 hypothetical protein [Candidatus Woesearchaeota archaeon]MBT7762952.1 hypothetical protein [Candidatus Woesearchaeota archaeon]
MAKRKKSQRVYKIGMLVLLALIVLGFTIPGFIDPTGEDQQVNVEPRLCQSDADCYLLCDDVPEQVLCSQNMCVRNSCQEYDLYPYNLDAIQFSLAVFIDSDQIDITKNMNDQDSFITFDGTTVSVFSAGISLGHILEKVDVAFDSECIFVNSENYCRSNDAEVSLFVNNEPSFEFASYVPENGDVVRVVYE